MNDDGNRSAEHAPDKATAVQAFCDYCDLLNQFIAAYRTFTNVAHFRIIAVSGVFIANIINAIFPIPVEKDSHPFIGRVSLYDIGLVLPPKGIVPALLGQRGCPTAVLLGVIAHGELRHIGTAIVFVDFIGAHQKGNGIYIFFIP